MPSTPPVEREQWLASLPRAYTSVGAVITDERGRALLVKSFRPYHQLVGGMIEPEEGPAEGAARETREEIGLELTAGRLLCISWVTASGQGIDQPGVQLYFDLGTIPADTELTLQESEIDAARWAEPAEFPALLGPIRAERLAAALAARADGVTRVLTVSRAELEADRGI
ncbi:NUDIX domain-containing protein [Kitasatospora sp. MMS16-BH015]|uniref:NUDIX domain-containing protein n=1 Tax=Kitasatospora sp. MMS16-BH015 TaxID=2018025 RepID=UPI000CA1D4F4|nr:NUDIX hydrolase [Kitasatospora sp. MMS16-BH015]AUG75609.1 NUDIX domain-containing protein [Kitasatospora sp. MMS16-BH015]